MMDLLEFPPPLFHRLKAIAGKLNINKAFNILDIGCGQDAILERLVKRSKIVGIDISSGALLRAKRVAPNASLIRGDMYHLPIKDGCINTCAMLAVLGALKEGTEVLAFEESNRVLKKGGIVPILVSSDSYIINKLAPEWRTGWRHFEPNLLCRWLERAGLKVSETSLTGGILSELVDMFYNNYWRRFWRAISKRTNEPPVPLKRIILGLTGLEFRSKGRRLTPARFIYLKAQKT